MIVRVQLRDWSSGVFGPDAHNRGRLGRVSPIAADAEQSQSRGRAKTSLCFAIRTVIEVFLWMGRWIAFNEWLTEVLCSHRTYTAKLKPLSVLIEYLTVSDNLSMSCYSRL